MSNYAYVNFAFVIVYSKIRGLIHSKIYMS